MSAPSNARRIMKDIESVIYPLDNWDEKQMYYYDHEDNNINEGIVMIMGVENSPYYGGFYFFKNVFPQNYPFSPPVWKFLSNDGKTRFNPNLYQTHQNGKVCLSILNTWGESTWSQIQRFSSVIETVRTHLFHDKPLLNEPGYSEKDPQNELYNRMLQYQNLNFNVYSNIVDTPEYAKPFRNIMIHNFRKNKEYYKKYIDDNKLLHNKTDIIRYDSQKVTYDFDQLEQKYQKLITICE